MDEEINLVGDLGEDLCFEELSQNLVFIVGNRHSGGRRLKIQSEMGGESISAGYQMYLRTCD